MGAADAAGRTLMSYMLFEGGYTRELIALGYEDARARRHELAAFLGLDLAAAGLERRHRSRSSTARANDAGDASIAPSLRPS
jgi:hypothetical protein